MGIQAAKYNLRRLERPGVYTDGRTSSPNVFNVLLIFHARSTGGPTELKRRPGRTRGIGDSATICIDSADAPKSY